MKAQFVWSPDWEESKLIAVDANAKITVRGYGSGYLAAVVFPMQKDTVTVSDENELLTAFHYMPEFLPSLELVHPVEFEARTYVMKRPAKEIAPSVRALLELADKWTVTDAKKKRDVHSETGWYEKLKIEPWKKKDSLRVRWVIAWQWPNLNRLRIGGKVATYEKRAELLNLFFRELGWTESIDPGTLKTTANRMELYFSSA